MVTLYLNGDSAEAKTFAVRKQAATAGEPSTASAGLETLRRRSHASLKDDRIALQRARGGIACPAVSPSLAVPPSGRPAVPPSRPSLPSYRLIVHIDIPSPARQTPPTPLTLLLSRPG